MQCLRPLRHSGGPTLCLAQSIKIQRGVAKSGGGVGNNENVSTHYCRMLWLRASAKLLKCNVTCWSMTSPRWCGHWGTQNLWPSTAVLLMWIRACFLLSHLLTPEWRSGLRHCISVQETSLQSLDWFKAVSHPAVIGSPIGRCTIGSASSGFVRDRPSL